MIDSKNFDDSVEADRAKLLCVFLKIENATDNFHRPEKQFAFRQRLNNFTKIGNKSEL